MTSRMTFKVIGMFKIKLCSASDITFDCAAGLLRRLYKICVINILMMCGLAIFGPTILQA